jgi:L-2-hydroxyglutarate oxidase LhgO
LTQQMLDVLVIGAGIIGLASARELLNRHPGLRVAVLEKEKRIASHQTGHNSGVIHSGVYYMPGSLRARLCVEGSRALYEYCSHKDIPAPRTGNVIVATSQTELPRLYGLAKRAEANGIEGCTLVGPRELKTIEPHCTGIEALHVPATGITDYRLMAQAFAEDVRDSGGQVRLETQVTAIQSDDDQVHVRTSSGETIHSRELLVCGGLQADRLAQMNGGSSDPAIVPFRGDYWLLRRPGLVRGLIYPVPDPAFPFLGVHLSRRVDGSVWLGPNAVLALAREGYKKWHVRPEDVMTTVKYRGFRRLAAKHWRYGLAEARRDLLRSLLVRELQRLVPDISGKDLVTGPWGSAPKPWRMMARS